MKQLVFIITFLFFSIIGFGQCPTSNITLSSQEEINAFAVNYPGCNQFEVNITISGTDITDFSGLSQIESNTGFFNIIDNPNLISFSGLGTIQLIGDFSGIFIQNNPILETLTPFTQGVEDISGLALNNCPLIDNLQAFEALTNVYEVQIIGNQGLISLSGLENIISVDTINVSDNPFLESLMGLNGVSGQIGELIIQSCNSLENLEGLEGITSENNFGINIFNNQGLTSLSGLQNITTLSFLNITNNDQLVSFDGLNISDGINGIYIIGNDGLTDIQALANVNIDLLFECIIESNSNLSICNMDSLCNYLSTDGVALIEGNATGCATVNEVKIACGILSMSENLLTTILAYPNPVSEILTIETTNTLNYNNAKVRTILGEIILETTVNQIDFSKISSGIYFVEVTTNEGTITKKIVKK